MLRPASSNGVYIRMSGACSTVSSIVKRGAISTMPPTLAAAMMASMNPIAERSSLRWKSSGISSFPRYGGGDDGHVRISCHDERHGPDRHPDVEAANDRAQ